ARDEASEEVVLVDGPWFQELDGHAVAVARSEPDLHRTEPGALPAEEDGPAEAAGEEAQSVRRVGRGERDVVEVVAVGHERGRLFERQRSRPKGRRSASDRSL